MAAAFPLLPAVSRWSTLPPEVPFVLTPWATGEHVRSSVYYLVVLITAGLLCSAPVEIGKLCVAQSNKPLLAYSALTMQQLILIADVIRSHGWDWWIFLMDMAHLSTIDRNTWIEGNMTTVGSWPWPSGITAIGIGSLVVVRLRSDA